MSAERRKRCVVAYATSERQFLWSVELEESATIAEALAAARKLAPTENVPWESAAVGVFGELCARSVVPADGDRIEIYRPLKDDPRERRRRRVRAARKVVQRRD